MATKIDPTNAEALRQRQHDAAAQQVPSGGVVSLVSDKQAGLLRRIIGV